MAAGGALSPLRLYTAPFLPVSLWGHISFVLRSSPFHCENHRALPLRAHSLWNHRCPSLLCPLPRLPKLNRLRRAKPNAAPGTCGPVAALGWPHISGSSWPVLQTSPIPAHIQGRTALSVLTNTLNNKGQQKRSRERRANIYKITSKSAFLKKKIFGKNRLRCRAVCVWVLVKHRTGKGGRLQCAPCRVGHLETRVPSHHPFGTATQRHAGSK